MKARTLGNYASDLAGLSSISMYSVQSSGFHGFSGRMDDPYRGAGGGTFLIMNSVSPGRIKPSSRRANSSMVAGSSRSRRASFRRRPFSVRTTANDSSSARYSRRAWIRADSPFSPTNASTRRTQPTQISRYRSNRPRCRHVTGGFESARDIGLQSCAMRHGPTCGRGDYVAVLAASSGT